MAVRAAALAGLVLLGAALTGALAAGYPAPPSEPHVDDYHGTKVPDPYRPLEDPDAPATRAWLDAEAALTTRYLEALPERDALRARLRQVVDYKRRGVPVRYGDRYLYSENPGLENQAVWYQTPSLDRPGTVLLDPNKLSADGTVSVSALAPSLDGKLVAYALAHAGSDWNEWHVRRTSDASDLPDVLQWSKFTGAAWLRDDSGFFYGRFPQPDPSKQFETANVDQKLYFHKLGTPQSADTVAYERTDDPQLLFSAEVTLDGRYLIVYESKGGAKNGLLVRDLSAKDGRFVRIFERDASYGYVHNAGTRFWFSTTKDAPRGKIVALDLAEPSRHTDAVPEAQDTLQSADVIGGKLFLSYLHDVHAVLKAYDLSGRFLHDVALPGLGSASISGWPDRDEAFLTYADYTTPPSIYRYDTSAERRTLWFAPSVPFDPSAYATEQVFVPSADGTRVPMYVIAKKGLRGPAPTILTGYGGFDISLNPSFSSLNVPWLENGGVLAVANLRGGGEYGEAWHEAGMLAHKQNVFDDFLACARFLTGRGTTTPQLLAAMGGSNGGLLVGAAITQQPERFGAAIVQVGVLDMLRYQRWTIGAVWVPEYGSSDDPAQFAALYAYSPLHRLRKGTAYPATLILTADHDDRVFPAHSFKFAAQMQADQGGPAPVLLRVEKSAGHGGGTPLAKSIESYADIYAFLRQNLRRGPGP